MDRWPDRVFQALLRLFPREFRGDFGEQMASDFEDQRHDAVHPRERRRLWRRTIAGVLRRAPAEHLDVLRQDVSFAFRLMRRTPGAAAAIVLTIAVGVGATTAVFTLADPMLFRPLPYPEADRLVRVSALADKPWSVLHQPDFLRAEATHGGFEAIAEFGVSTVGRLEGGSEDAFAYAVTRGFFDVFGVRPALGREFTAEEYALNAAADKAVVTHAFWQSAFGGAPDIIGRTFDVRSGAIRRFEIIGVMPPGFVLPQLDNRAPDFLLAIRPDPARPGLPNRLSFPVARLAPGASRASAAAEMQAIAQSVEADFPAVSRNRQVVLTDLQEVLFGRVRTPLLLLLGATGCVLLLACVNLAHLFLSRLQARQREFAVRLALGAGRPRLIRLLVIESGAYALAGALGALVLGQLTFDLLVARTPELAYVYRLLPARVDLRVVALAAALAGVALLIFGAIPAFRASRLDVRAALIDGGSATSRLVRPRSAFALIALQSAAAMVLVVIGALLLHSFARLAWQPLGYDPHAVVSLSLTLPAAAGAGAGDNPQWQNDEKRRLYEHLRDRLGAPVTAAAGWPGMTLPANLRVPGAPKEAPKPIAYPVSSTFFDVFSIRLLAGRLYTEAEALEGASVAVLDQRAADLLWPGQQPLGHTVVDSSGVERQVIGVIGTIRTSLVGDRDGSAFMPIGRAPSSFNLAYRPVRGSPSLEELQAAVQAVAPRTEVSVHPYRPFERTLGQPRFLAALLGTLNGITLILAAVGIFGVVNHGAARRTREMGIRMALGATAVRIRRMVVTAALVPAALGMAAGAGIALWWTPALQSLLFGIEPSDPLTYAAAAAIVTLVVLAGSLLPAWRVSRVLPTSALRAE
jgi:putative ABC transport system permease protein